VSFIPAAITPHKTLEMFVRTKMIDRIGPVADNQTGTPINCADSAATPRRKSALYWRIGAERDWRAQVIVDQLAQRHY
jgi:hypothetical protein